MSLAMSSSVMPAEFSSQEDKAMSPETKDEASLSASCIGESKGSKQNVIDGLLRAAEDVYSRLLKMMKFFEAYVGDTNFSRFSSEFPGSTSSEKQGYIFVFYSCLVVAGLWFNFAVPCISFYSLTCGVCW